ncbi:MAG TPA: hypothetical protein VG347_24350 [Verrucomicrobiae bacterium]|nr:hypothetical protein [Verrucomicrobiae bacterium]
MACSKIAEFFLVSFYAVVSAGGSDEKWKRKVIRFDESGPFLFRLLSFGLPTNFSAPAFSPSKYLAALNLPKFSRSILRKTRRIFSFNNAAGGMAPCISPDGYATCICRDGFKTLLTLVSSYLERDFIFRQLGISVAKNVLAARSA